MGAQTGIRCSAPEAAERPKNRIGSESDISHDSFKMAARTLRIGKKMA